ncbi:MAG: arginyltransferase [Rhodospirillaceae bacterium]|jgi:leucyl-tRNA---protein transferase|nr:arginyltransferase [Rhodospirillaceae bacterium]
MHHATAKLPKYFYRTAPQACPYLGGRTERNIFAELNGRDLTGTYDLLARHGFRRSHKIVYRPDCPGCKACVPVRVVTAEFEPSRNMRRIARVNADLTVEFGAPHASIEQFRLFRRYVETRHADGEMAGMGYVEYRGMIEDTAVDTRLALFRDSRGDLVAACLLDALGDGLSAVYSFFDIDKAERSLGTFVILWLIERSRAEGLPYTYLGYWIAASRKMAYKARFQPLEALTPDGWERMSFAWE